MQEVERQYPITSSAVPLACDIETTGLDEYRPGARIVSCSFTVTEGVSKVLYFADGEAPRKPPEGLPESKWGYWNDLWYQINWLLTTPKVALRGANFKYDSRWINYHWGINCTNQTFDTTLVGSLLDENRSNNLKLHAKIFTPLGGYDDQMTKEDMAHMELVPIPKIVSYNGGDTDATLRVSKVFRSEVLKNRRLANLYTKLVQPAAKVFEKMERNGIYVDVPYYQKLQGDLEEEISGIKTQILDLIPSSIKKKYEDNLSITRPALLRDFLFTKAGLGLKPVMWTAVAKEPSIATDHLMSFSEHPVAKEFVSLYSALGSAEKTLSTFVVGFLKHLRPDGKFHPSFMLHRGTYGGDSAKDDAGTVTGRTSAKDPAVQTIPEHTKWAKRLRRAFPAPPGYTILHLDYSQGELKICAVVAKEEVMLSAYLNGMDLHSITASRLNGYSMDEFMLLPDDVRDELRAGGKAGNFGLLYGMQHLGFRDYAWYSFGVSMTEEQAFTHRQAFFELYPRLLLWHEESKAYARRHLQVTSPLGRDRHLPLINSSDREARSKAERQAINSPIQSTLSDLMQLAMVHIDRRYGDEDIEMFLMTHDSLSLRVPIDRAVEWAVRLKEVMENLPLKEDFGWDSPLKFTTDAKVGAPDDEGVISLASLQKLKAA
jgi:DNA polymerase I-like protein with 3'-5' exonuclease and polymerase domains